MRFWTKKRRISEGDLQHLLQANAFYTTRAMQMFSSDFSRCAQVPDEKRGGAAHWVKALSHPIWRLPGPDSRLGPDTDIDQLIG